MKPFSRAKIAASAVLVLLSSTVVAEKKASTSAADWSPYALGDTSYTELFDYYSTSKVIPLYDDSHTLNGIQSNTEQLSVGFSDPEQGIWKVSLDLNQSQESAFAEEQYSLNSAYSPNNGESTFYIDYGNRRVPVSIKVDDFLEYSQSQLSDKNLSLGLEQQLNDSWAVSISYTKSELEQQSSGGSQLYFGQGNLINQRYWFDLNQDGLPEAVNLFSELGASTDFDKAAEGIEIRLTRQATEKLSFGGQVSRSDLDVNFQPYQLDTENLPSANIGEKSFSLFGQYDIGHDWRLDANLSRNFIQENSPQVVSLLSTDTRNIDFDSTTLDIGVQYQGRWDDMGLVIRIDLLNLLGGNSDSERNTQPLDESGLMPYTFQSPKYIKLSGSINF